MNSLSNKVIAVYFIAGFLSGGLVFAQNKQDLPPGVVKVPILVYHSIRNFHKSDTDLIKSFVVPPLALEKELRYLRDHHYTGITISDLVRHFTQNTTLPAQPVILTFDDGWENEYANGFTLLKKYGFKATFFIFTNGIGSKNFLTWDEVKTMEAAGIEIGGHTKSHPYLYKITDINQLRDEIAGGKKITEEKLGHKIYAFATPFGETSDKIIQVAKEAGYTSLRNEHDKGVYVAAADIFSLKGNGVTDNLDNFKKILELKQ